MTSTYTLSYSYLDRVNGMISSVEKTEEYPSFGDAAMQAYEYARCGYTIHIIAAKLPTTPAAPRKGHQVTNATRQYAAVQPTADTLPNGRIAYRIEAVSTPGQSREDFRRSLTGCVRGYTTLVTLSTARRSYKAAWAQWQAENWTAAPKEIPEGMSQCDACKGTFHNDQVISADVADMGPYDVLCENCQKQQRH